MAATRFIFRRLKSDKKIVEPDGNHDSVAFHNSSHLMYELQKDFQKTQLFILFFPFCFQTTSICSGYATSLSLLPKF